MAEVTTWTGRYAQALRKAMRLTIEAFAQHLDVAVRTVSYWESRPQVQPRPFQQSLLDTAYARVDEATRQRFLSLLAEPVAPTIAAEPATSAGDGDAAAMVRSTMIGQVHAAADVFTKWDHERGAIAVSQAANAQMAWAKSLLKLPCPDSLRTDLLAATAHLGLVAGFVNFDSHCHAIAAEIFIYAAECAQQAGDPHLEAKLLSHRARQAVYCGMNDQALPLLEQALALPGLTATEQAMLHTGQARAYAKQGRIAETLHAIQRADDAFDRANPGLDPAWMAYYDGAQHMGDTGHALFDLAVEGWDETAAITRFREAINGHTDAYVRSRAFSMTKLASLLMAIGEPLEATTVALEALPIVTQLGSERENSLLRELLRFSNPHRRIGAVNALRSQLAVLVAP